MRLNKYIALHTEYSRRAADELINQGLVTVNGQPATQGQDIAEDDRVSVKGRAISAAAEIMTVMMNKPAGYVCSRNGQGSPPVYELLPAKYRHLNSVGRLDKESSGLLLFSNDGELVNRLTHPSHQKVKVYEVILDKPLQPLHQQMISDHGVTLEDGPSKFEIEKDGSGLRVSLKEGRNRQVRRTFAALGYEVTGLHRVNFGEFALGKLLAGDIQTV